jgi:RNA polymerase sigma factor (sigma-70 family)
MQPVYPKFKSYTENELVALLRSNHRGAFEYLYEHYSPALYGIICKILKDKDKADDVLQDSFLKIWRNIGFYNTDKGTLFTWMLNVARNTAIDKLRSDVKFTSDVNWENVPESELCRDAIFNPLPATMDVSVVVGWLIPERQVLIEMVYFQGYTHQEVSEQLNIPLGTVKSRIRVALQELRRIFAVPVPTEKLQFA